MIKIIAVLYLLIINIVAFYMCALDKKRAMIQGWRISEFNLMLVSVLGGSVGMYAAMRICRHKTKHMKFVLGVPAIFICQVIIAFVIIHMTA